MGSKGISKASDSAQSSAQGWFFQAWLSERLVAGVTDLRSLYAQVTCSIDAQSYVETMSEIFILFVPIYGGPKGLLTSNQAET